MKWPRVVVDHSIVKVTYSPRFLLNAYKHKHNANYKGTLPLSFINVKTILGLQFAISEKSQRRYPQNAVGKRSLP